jgi:hypothetical protein
MTVSSRLDVRPRRARWVAIVVAVVLLVVFTMVGVLLRRTSTGVYFTTADQVAMIVLGVFLAGLALLFTLPRLRADEHGVYVRNIMSSHHLPWPLVQRVSFPDGASWARLELPGDEYIAVLAIQAADGPHAVAAMQALRELHRQHAPPAPQPSRAPQPPPQPPQQPAHQPQPPAPPPPAQPPAN